MEIKTKYPRTYHLPYSPGLQNDDRKVEKGWEKLLDNEIIITEKLDGQNTSCSNIGVFARSHAAQTELPWDRNMWEQGGIYDQVKSWLDDDVMIYGENLYGIHSIEYNKLPAYYFLFALRDKNVWKSWDEVVEMSHILGLPTVPVLFRGKVSSEKELEEMIYNFMKQGSSFGNTIEGCVIRNANDFDFNDFSLNVVKYVRKGHVQTDQFWAKNWKRAKLIYEQ